MIWKVARQIQRLISFLILIVLLTKQLEAEINNNCPRTGLVESAGLCISTLEIIDETTQKYKEGDIDD